VAVMSTLTDDFTTQDTGKWTFASGASVSGGQLVMQCLSTYSSEANSVGWYDLTGSYLAPRCIEWVWLVWPRRGGLTGVRSFR
jgi:hypothetical protein